MNVSPRLRFSTHVVRDHLARSHFLALSRYETAWTMLRRLRHPPLAISLLTRWRLAADQWVTNHKHLHQYLDNLPSVVTDATFTVGGTSSIAWRSRPSPSIPITRHEIVHLDKDDTSASKAEPLVAWPVKRAHVFCHLSSLQNHLRRPHTQARWLFCAL